MPYRTEKRLIMQDGNRDDRSDEGFDAKSYWKKLNGEPVEEESPQEEYWNSMTDYGKGHSGDPDYGPVPEEYRSTGMSKASLACGIISVFSILFGTSVIFGGFGLLFALLSRRKKFSKQARTGAILSTIGIVIFGIMLAIAVTTLVSTGVWDHMMTQIREMDPDDPDAVARIQQNVLDELQRKLLAEYYGIGGTGGGAETAGDAGAAGIAGTAGEAGAAGSGGTAGTPGTIGSAGGAGAADAANGAGSAVQIAFHWGSPAASALS